MNSIKVFVMVTLINFISIFKKNTCLSKCPVADVHHVLIQLIMTLPLIE